MFTCGKLSLLIEQQLREVMNKFKETFHTSYKLRTEADRSGLIPVSKSTYLIRRIIVTYNIVYRIYIQHILYIICKEITPRHLTNTVILESF